jgi:hypothetical protein
VGPATPTGDTVTGVLVAARSGTPGWGTATAFLPLLGNLSPMTEQEMREFIAHLPYLLAAINFEVNSESFHEGHGTGGTRGPIQAGLGPSRPIVSATTHRALVEQINQGFGDAGGMVVTWSTQDAAFFAAHGAFDRPLPAMTTLTGDSVSEIAYTPRAEPAKGAGEPFEEYATIQVTAPAGDVIKAFYRMPNPQLAPMLESALVGTLSGLNLPAYENVPVGWHAPGLTLTINDAMNVELEAGVGFVGRLERRGQDELSGTLSRRSDGTYAGVLTAAISRSAKMQLTVPLAAGGCEGHTNTSQAVYVVGTRVPSAVKKATDHVADGEFGRDDLLLRLYPIGDPTAPPLWCEDMLPWTGVRRIDGHLVKRALIPLNDLRWTTPGRLRVHLPDVHGSLKYYDSADEAPLRGFNSTWTFTVVRGE